MVRSGAACSGLPHGGISLEEQSLFCRHRFVIVSIAFGGRV